MSAVAAHPEHSNIDHGHASHDDHTGHDDHAGEHFNLHHNRVGLWMFFFSEVFLFGGLLAARFYLWRGDHGEVVRPDLGNFGQLVGLAVTVILLISSWSINMAETGMEHDDRRTFNIGMWTTFILGTLFLFGVMIFEWGIFPFIYEAHFKPWDGAFGAVIFAMTGMHALHVLSGLIFIAIVWNNARMGHYSSESHWGVEACAIYWHYVDLVWVFFYPALYLIGTVYHH
ncbi:MAG: cytochrome c oxidase subunit 3 [Chloroflexota bacterium]